VVEVEQEGPRPEQWRCGGRGRHLSPPSSGISMNGEEDSDVNILS
jgi:hypothetical protein